MFCLLGDLMNNYCWADDLMNVMRLLFCFVVLLTFPMECFVSREVVENIIWGDGIHHRFEKV